MFLNCPLNKDNSFAFANSGFGLMVVILFFSIKLTCPVASNSDLKPLADAEVIPKFLAN